MIILSSIIFFTVSLFPVQGIEHVSTLKPEQSQKGKIDNTDPIVDSEFFNLKLGEVVRGDSFCFRLKEDGEYFIEARSLDTDLYLILRNQENEILHEDDDGLIWINPQISFKGRANTKYILNVCGLHYVYGHYSVKVTKKRSVESYPGIKEKLELDLGWQALRYCENKHGESHRNTIGIRNTLAQFLKPHDPDGCKKLFEQNLRLSLESLGEEDKHTARAFLNYGMFLFSSGASQKGEEYVKQAFSIFEKITAQGSLTRLRAMCAYAETLVINDKLYDAQALLSEYAQTIKQNSNKKYDAILSYWICWWYWATKCGHAHNMEKYSRQAYVYSEKINGKLSEDTLFGLARYSEALIEVEKYKQAIVQAKEIVNRISGLNGKQSDLMLDALDVLISATYQQHDYHRCIQYCEKRYELAKSLYGMNHEAVAGSLWHWGACFRRMGRHQSAIGKFKEALPVMEEVWGANNKVTRNLKQTIRKLQTRLSK